MSHHREQPTPELCTPAQPAPFFGLTIRQYLEREGIHRATLEKRRKKGTAPPMRYDDRGRLMVVMEGE